MNTTIFKAFVISMVMAFSTSSQAGVINSSDVAGYGTFTDDVTGYIWLDINAFYGNAGNPHTAGQMKSLAEAAGFTIATLTDVRDLFSHMTLANNWASNKAIIGDSSTRELIWGFTESETNSTVFNWAWVWSNSTSLQASTSTYNSNDRYSDIGIWAFKTSNSTQVPEPTTLAIFALGILGLAARRFKK